ncbi:hypothetical protein Pcinc_023351 [Petrolisthes cinctipes]|uniref:Uncharacterized protein n=1 Tax=Petrolisthes cinctipes TaxID=88211 RepID=A0AAE1KEM3_PETCI|nr:hypothetical protein Pcinc_023351 [Petrolisthes cinctipes]
MTRVLLVVVLESSTTGAPCHVDNSNVVQSSFRIKQAKIIMFIPWRTCISGGKGGVGRARDIRRQDVADDSTLLSAISSRIRIFNSSKLFRSRPHNLEELKMRIREEIAAIPLEMCRRAAENFRHGLQQGIATDGHHLPDAIFKK